MNPYSQKKSLGLDCYVSLLVILTTFSFLDNIFQYISLFIMVLAVVPEGWPGVARIYFPSKQHKLNVKQQLLSFSFCLVE